MRMAMGLFIGLLLVLWRAPWAYAHESVYHSPTADAETEAPGEAEGVDPLQGLASELAYYFGLFTKLECEAPTLEQPATLALCDAIYPYFGQYSSLTPTIDRPRSEESARESLVACRERYALLRERYGAVTLGWSPGAVQPLDGSAALTITAGLMSYPLIEIRNDGPETLVVAAMFERTPVPPSDAVRIATGETRAIVAPLLVVGEAGLRPVRLDLTPESGASVAVDVSAEVQQPATITGSLVEGASGQVSPGRLYVAGKDGLCRFDPEHAGNSTLTTKPILQWGKPTRDYRFMFSYCGGTFSVSVPPGDARLMLERGFEHPVESLDVVGLAPGETRSVSLASRRFCDMKALGWVSGDTHIHWAKNWWSEDEDIALLAMVQRAEDLRVANNLTLKQVNPDLAFIAPAQFPMGPVPGYCDDEYHIQMAEEYRNDSLYGHVCFLNIRDLIQPISTGRGSGGGPEALDYPTNRWAIEQCHAQGGISTEAHNLGPFGRSDVPANAVLGLSDAFDQMDPEVYYGFLNAGLRIPLGNGSDHPARIAGCARVYVKVDGPFTYGGWIEGIRQRRTFTTSGPLLFLSVNDADIGDVVDVARGTPLRVRASARSRFPIGALQIVSNGSVVAGTHIDGTEGELVLETTADEPCWFVARCSTSDVFSALVHPGIAHTSAIYVDVEGSRVLRPDDVRRWIGLLQAHRENVAQQGRFDTEDQRREALGHIEEGIAAYEGLLSAAKEENPGAAGRM